MMTEILASLEARLRPLLTRLPPRLAIRVASWGRRAFLASFYRARPRRMDCPEGLERTLWGIRFRSPIANAAGMFKTGEGYDVPARQGAGAYLAGTTTHRPREGNRKAGVFQPFAPYPRSGAASNWLGLPNPGHAVVAERLRTLERVEGCPVGASVAACPDPEVGEEEKLEQLVAGMALYERAGVDFLEMNESCPNTEAGEIDLRRRLVYVSEHFLARRRRTLPVVVKFSCDTDLDLVPDLVAMLAKLEFDGVNFGNTSMQYGRHGKMFDPAERVLLAHFTLLFSGGLSGRPLKETSLRLVERAAACLRDDPPGHEMHVVRTGGIESAADVEASLEAGASLCQWYSGYFEAFGRHGHRVYKELYRELDRAARPALA